MMRLENRDRNLFVFSISEQCVKSTNYIVPLPLDQSGLIKKSVFVLYPNRLNEVNLRRLSASLGLLGRLVKQHRTPGACRAQT